MRKAIITEVVPIDEESQMTEENSVELIVVYDADTVEFRLDGKRLFVADWANNMKNLLQEMEKAIKQ
jgi:CRISPR/Cas system CSM-associated protein Csm4 (group 5 of RAMP superfamily)